MPSGMIPLGRLVDQTTIAVGFPDWHASSSAACHAEIFISPMEDDLRMVLAILAHEVVHACLPAGTGHKHPFVVAAGKLGFLGPFTMLKPSEDLWAWIDLIIADLPCYPHASLGRQGVSEGSPKKQANRQLKATCDTCGFTFRASKQWLSSKPELRCPDHDCDGLMVCEGLGEDGGGDDGEEG